MASQSFRICSSSHLVRALIRGHEILLTPTVPFVEKKFTEKSSATLYQHQFSIKFDPSNIWNSMPPLLIIPNWRQITRCWETPCAKKSKSSTPNFLAKSFCKPTKKTNINHFYGKSFQVQRSQENYPSQTHGKICMDLQIKATILVGFGLFFYVFLNPLEGSLGDILAPAGLPPLCAPCQTSCRFLRFLGVGKNHYLAGNGWETAPILVHSQATSRG